MARKVESLSELRTMDEHIRTMANSRFTNREQTILRLVVDGMSNKEIAEHLILSPTTVKWYIKQIFNKLGVNRRTQVVKMVSDLHLMGIKAPEQSPTPVIPTPLTQLIGREIEINEIINLLNEPTVRLVTILGVGGVGKTRLALEVARRQATQKPGQVSFIALDSVDSLSGMVKAVAAAINLQFHGSLDISRQLLTNLRRRKLILVLDNFEHLLEATTFVSEMLIAAPRLQILVTSRERLCVSAETIYPLQGLDNPITVDHFSENHAFTYFMQVAHFSRPNFQPDANDVVHICRICRLVEGMPLAIELAAKWINLLSPGEIAEEIVKGLGILQTSRKDLPERHRSIRAVLESSWLLLSRAERLAVKKLCVFIGGFDRVAAEKVTGTTLYTLSALVDKSLLIHVGKDCYRLHELMRQFAIEKMQADADEYTHAITRWAA